MKTRYILFVSMLMLSMVMALKTAEKRGKVRCWQPETGVINLGCNTYVGEPGLRLRHYKRHRQSQTRNRVRGRKRRDYKKVQLKKTPKEKQPNNKKWYMLIPALYGCLTASS